MPPRSDLFAGTAPTIDEQISCAVRELHMRQRLYPEWVEQKRLKPHVAENELKVMAAIVETLERVRDGLPNR